MVILLVTATATFTCFVLLCSCSQNRIREISHLGFSMLIADELSGAIRQELLIPGTIRWA